MQPNSSRETPEVLELLRKNLAYDPDTGIFTRINPDAKRYYGKVAGTKMKSGYIRVSCKVDGKIENFLAHRVAMAFTDGVWPLGFVDHKDRVKDNNRRDNLREVDKSVNVYNYSRNGKNLSGQRGVFIDDRNPNRIYRAAYGKKHLGSFYSLEEAAACYKRYVATIHEIVVED